MAKSKKLKCKQCGKQWVPLVAGHKPLRCPNRECQSRNWNQRKR